MNYSHKDLYDMPKDMLVKLISTIQEEKEKEIQSRLKLFRVTHPNYSTHIGVVSFICVASNKEEARNIHPGGDNRFWDTGYLDNTFGRRGYSRWINKEQIHSLEVSEIGIAHPEFPAGKIIERNVTTE